MANILILNQGNTENYGDVAINSALVNFFINKNNTVDFCPFWDEKLVFGNNFYNLPYIFQKQYLKTFRRIDYFNKKRFKKVLKKKSYDAVIVGGGELLGNHVGFNSSLYVLSGLLDDVNIPLIVFGVSGSPKLEEEITARNRKSLLSASKLYVRDRTTQYLCENTYEVMSTYCPDVVFGLHKIKGIRNDEDNREGMVIAPMIYNDLIKNNLHLNDENEYLSYLEDFIDENKIANEKITVTCTALEDSNMVMKLYERLKISNNNVFYEEYSNLEEYECIISNSRLVISARMHALILGIINGCIVQTIPFKEKLIEFKDTYNNKTVNVESLASEVDFCLNEIDKYIKEIENGK